MKYFLTCLLLLIMAIVHSEEMPIAKIKTNFGTIVIELELEKAPITVKNFLRYAEEGFYEGTIFHRVIRHFVIQGGGYTQNYEKKPTHDPITNEGHNGLKNQRATIAMGRSQEPHSATSQFFININHNDFINYQSSMYSQWGYTVFGRVTEGMDVVNKIQKVKTSANGPFKRHVPVEPVIIEKITIIANISTKQKTDTLSAPLDEFDDITEDDFLEAIIAGDTEENTPNIENQTETTNDVLDVGDEIKKDIRDVSIEKNTVKNISTEQKTDELSEFDDITEDDFLEAIIANNTEENIPNTEDQTETEKKVLQPTTNMQVKASFTPTHFQPKTQIKEIKVLHHTSQDSQRESQVKALQTSSHCQLKIDSPTKILQTPTVFLSPCDLPSEPDKPELLSD
jgi:cyclophilin family peptidyl-prolyl cis-trans isomerase